MRKAVVTMGAAAVALALAAATAPLASATVAGSVGAAKTVPAGKYAKSLCTTFTTWQQSLSASNVPTADITDAAAGKQALAGYFTGLVSSTQTAITKLKKAGIPDVDHGKQVARSFKTFLARASSEISGALTQVNAADPASPSFVDTISQVTTQLSTLDTRLGDPFSKVGSQDLLVAFKGQQACRGLVTIIGG